MSVTGEGPAILIDLCFASIQIFIGGVNGYVIVPAILNPVPIRICRSRSRSGFRCPHQWRRCRLDFPQKSRHGQAQSFTFCFSYSAGQRFSRVGCFFLPIIEDFKYSKMECKVKGAVAIHYPCLYSHLLMLVKLRRS